MTDRPLSPTGSQRRGTAKFGDTVAEVSSAGASVDEQPAGVQAFIEGCMLHVADQLYGNGCALALCALFLALGICCFTIGVFALAMNQFFLGRMLKDEPSGLLVASALCLLLTGSLGCLCTCRTESGLCSLPRFLLFAFWPTFTSLWLAIAALSVSVDLQNPVILGFDTQWSLLSRDSWDAVNKNKATSIEGSVLQAYLTSDPGGIDYQGDFDWRAIVAETHNEYVYASVELTLSDRSSSFLSLAASNGKADYLIQINGGALGKYNSTPSQSNFYDVANALYGRSSAAPATLGLLERCDAALQNASTRATAYGWKARIYSKAAAEAMEIKRDTIGKGIGIPIANVSGSLAPEGAHPEAWSSNRTTLEYGSYVVLITMLGPCAFPERLRVPRVAVGASTEEAWRRVNKDFVSSTERCDGTMYLSSSVLKACQDHAPDSECARNVPNTKQGLLFCREQTKTANGLYYPPLWSTSDGELMQFVDKHQFGGLVSAKCMEQFTFDPRFLPKPTSQPPSLSLATIATLPPPSSPPSQPSPPLQPPPSTPPSMPPPPSTPPCSSEQTGCCDDCRGGKFSDDGQCDDQSGLCSLGSDCSDCGPRMLQPSPPSLPPPSLPVRGAEEYESYLRLLFNDLLGLDSENKAAAEKVEKCYLESYWWDDAPPTRGLPLEAGDAKDAESAAVFSALGMGDVAINSKAIWCYCTQGREGFRQTMIQIISFVQGACATIITPLAIVLLVQCCMCCRSRLQRAPPKPAAAAALVLTTIAPQLSDDSPSLDRKASIVQLALARSSTSL